MNRRPIGILGGMGPEATILLQQKLLASVEATDDADHIPLIVDMNPQVPSRIAHLIEGTGADPTPVLVAMAKRLEHAGAAALAMPCITAHHYAEAIAEAVAIPFLNMVEHAADACLQADPAGLRVGILASPAVRMTELVDRALAARGLHAVWPEDMDALLAAIREIKAHGVTADALARLDAASRDLLHHGAEVQLVACTEFSLAAEALASGARMIDALDALVAAIRDRGTGSAGPEA